MNKLKFILFCIFTCSLVKPSFAKNNQYLSFNINLKPVVNYSLASTSGDRNTIMNKFSIGWALGAEANLPLTQYLEIGTVFSYGYQSQNVKHHYFNEEMLDPSSFTSTDWGYFNLSYGIQAKYNWSHSQHYALNTIIGFTFLNINIYQYSYKQHIVGSNMLQDQVGIGYYVTPDNDWSVYKRYLNITLGSSYKKTYKKIGTFQVGLSVVFPFGDMPDYTYSGAIDYKGKITTSQTSFHSRQYSVVVSIGYQLFRIKIR